MAATLPAPPLSTWASPSARASTPPAGWPTCRWALGDLSHPVNIDASGQTLIFNAENNKKLELHAIEIESLQGTTITAKKIFINAGNTKSRAEGIRVGGQNGTNKDTPYKLTINGDMDIRAHGANYGLGMYLCGNAETTVNGNVTMNTPMMKRPLGGLCGK